MTRLLGRFAIDAASLGMAHGAVRLVERPRVASCVPMPIPCSPVPDQDQTQARPMSPG